MATTLQVQKQFSVNGLAEEAKIYQKNMLSKCPKSLFPPESVLKTYLVLYIFLW